MARRRQVLRGVFGAAAAAIGAACVPTSNVPSATLRKYRIGFLLQRAPQCVVPGEWEVNGGVAIKTAQTRPPDVCSVETGLLEALEKRGYRQGENLEWIVATPAEYLVTGVADLLPPAAALVALRVEIIITVIVESTIAAAQATTTIPIVAQINDIVETGLVSSLAHPGGNITGASGSLVGVTQKKLELLKEAFPWVKRPILVYGNFGAQRRAVGPAVEAARQMGLSAVAILLTGDGSDFLAKLDTAFAEGADSLVEVGSFPGVAEQVLPLVKQRRLPSVVSPEPLDIEAGGLIGLGAVRDPAQVADYVDRILKGQNPGDLPIMAPTTFNLVVNLKAAESLGLTIAPSVVARATTVIR
jgi:putative ABC transport system substrate-binding protein